MTPTKRIRCLMINLSSNHANTGAVSSAFWQTIFLAKPQVPYVQKWVAEMKPSLRHGLSHPSLLLGLQRLSVRHCLTLFYVVFSLFINLTVVFCTSGTSSIPLYIIT